MLTDLALRCKASWEQLRIADTHTRNSALHKMADALISAKDEILSANALDLNNAEKAGLSPAMLERLTLTPARIDGMAAGMREVAAQPDPIGSMDRVDKRPNGLSIGVKRVPLGLVGVIYESRPNVTADVAALCVKSGNACLLRGGKEAILSNKSITQALCAGLEAVGLPGDCVRLVEDTSRESANDMMRLTGILDVLIPRGSASLIRAVVENSRVPVIETGAGNCHTYVDDEADLDMAASITFNAKCSRPSVCNAMETLLVSEKVAEEFLPKAKALLDTKNVELRGCEKTRAILGGGVVPAAGEDWETEYNDYILAVKVVSGLYEATAHINKYGTGHSEAIVTRNYFTAQRFIDRVDAACVYVNASTRFTDGGEFGFGAEIGISTQKLHARGPMGLRHLTSVQYVVYGEGQIR